MGGLIVLAVAVSLFSVLLSIACIRVSAREEEYEERQCRERGWDV